MLMNLPSPVHWAPLDLPQTKACRSVGLANGSASRAPGNGSSESGGLDNGFVRRERCAVLAADVVAYSLLIERDELGTVYRLRDLYSNVLVPAAVRQSGYIIRVMGDGVLMVFADAISASRCALMIQCRPPTDLRVRIGIDIGDALFIDGDIHGRNVIVAARLEALGRPGDILLSSNVYDEVDTHIQTRCEALGHRKVKHVTQPVDVYRIGS